MTSALDAFFSGGGKSLSWGKVGSQEEAFWLNRPRGGVVVSVGEPSQQTNLDTGDPIWWDPKTQQRPKMQIPITVDTTQGPTNERDPNDPSDLGHRVIWAKGGLQIAITDALRQAGNVPASRMVGGLLLVAMTGTKPGERGKNGMRVYAGQFTPGVAQAQATDAMFAGDPQGGQQPAATPFGAQPAPPQQSTPFGQPQPGQPDRQQGMYAAAQQAGFPPQQAAQVAQQFVAPPAQQPAGAPQQWQPQAPQPAFPPQGGPQQQQQFVAPSAQQPAAQQFASPGPNTWQQFDQPQAPVQDAVPPGYAQFNQQQPVAPQWQQPQAPAPGGPVSPFA